MKSSIFADHAARYWDVKLSALPVIPETKKPSVDKWTSYQANLPSESRRKDWIRQFGSHGLGINTGTEVVPGRILVGVDIDDDQLVDAVTNFFGTFRCAKRGQKGLTIFVTAEKHFKIKSTTLTGGHGIGNIDILAGGRFTVVPPSIHPETKLPYEWIGEPLDKVDFGMLPGIDTRRIQVQKKAVGSKHALVLITGQKTHDAGVAYVAELVASGATDAEIGSLINGLLPQNYSGNSRKELDGWISSARAKGYDQVSEKPIYDPGSVGPIPLGFTKEGTFVVRDQVRGIILVQTSNQLLSPQVLLGLAPSDFWSKQFRKETGGFSPMVAGEAVIVACRACGPFESKKVRGNGVWMENGQIVKNLGEVLPPDLRQLYLSFSAIPIVETSEFQTARLLELLRRFPFKDDSNADLLLGWMALAPLAGALNWRPHGFLFGPPNSGKTTLHNLVSRILVPMVVAADGQSTEAGIRQSLGPDALPVVLDEFETDSNQSRLHGIMRLARSASSAESPLLRGTPEGKAVQFSIRTMFLFSAVNVVGMTPADQSRITVMELSAHESDSATAAKIEGELANFAELGPQWCGYMVGYASEVIRSIPILKDAMGAYDSRLRQTMASLLAGMFVALNCREPTKTEAIALAAKYQSTIDLHRIDQERDNAQECLAHLMAHTVGDTQYVGYPLGHWLALEMSRLKGGDGIEGATEAERIVTSFNIKFHLTNEHQGFLIRNAAPAINRIFEGTVWSNGAWKRALGQLDGAFSLANPQRFVGAPGKHRCVGLPLKYVPEAFTRSPQGELY